MYKNINILPIIAIVTTSLFGLFGVIPFYIVLIFTDMIIPPLFLFVGINAYLGFRLLRKDNTSKIYPAYIVSVVIVILACAGGECLLSYSTLLFQYRAMGIQGFSYFNITSELPVTHLLGYYFGINSIGAEDSSIVFGIVLKMWGNLILSVIFALAGVLVLKFIINFTIKKKSGKSISE